MIWSQKNKSEYLPKIRLKAPRVHLYPPRLEHCDQWISVRANNKDRLKPLEPTWPKGCLDKDFFVRRLKRQSQEWKEDNAYPFLIFGNDTGNLIGGININHVCRGAAQYASLGYWMDESHQGQGLMTEAMRVILKFGFDSLNLHRLNAAVLTHNQRSIKLLVRNGFRQEGLAEKYIRIDGKWQDHVLFGLPVELWREHVRTGHIHHTS